MDLNEKRLSAPRASAAFSHPRKGGFLRRNAPFIVLGVVFVLCICLSLFGDDVKNYARVWRGDRERDVILTEWIDGALGDDPSYAQIDKISWNEYDYWDYDPPFPRMLHSFNMAQDADLYELTLAVKPDMPADELAEFLPRALAALSDAPARIVRAENALKIDIVQQKDGGALTLHMTTGEPLRDLDLSAEIEALLADPGDRSLLVTSVFY